MQPALQAKLLRVLQEREFRPIGGTRAITPDFRLMCATNVDLDQALSNGTLRRDLYFRINTITLTVPPLRERPDDIPLLAEHFRVVCAEKHNREVKAFEPEARRLLVRHPWPGNVRELEHVVERAVIVGEGELIRVGDLPEGDPQRRADAAHDVQHPARSHAGRARADGHRADARAHPVEQAGRRALARDVPADALQQAEEIQDSTSRDPGGRARASRRRRTVADAASRVQPGPERA